MPRSPESDTPTDPPAGNERPQSIARWLQAADWQRAAAFGVVFLVMAGFFNVQSGGIFLTPRNLSLLLRQGALITILATGVAVLMVMAEIDLSIGSAVFLTGVVAAQMDAVYEWPLILTILGTVAAGVALGAIQGLWVVKLRIPSFVATLAGLLVWRGLGLLWTNAQSVGPVSPGLKAVSESFIPPSMSYLLLGAVLAVALGFGLRAQLRRHSLEKHLHLAAQDWVRLIGAVAAIGALAWISGGFNGLPMAVVWAVILVVAFFALLRYTVFGRSAYLVGANRDAATFSGIVSSKVILRGFALMGAIYGIGGLLLTARIGVATPSAGEFLELDAIAAAVIGGVSLRGGSGTVLGAAMGALLLTTINNGMSILNISSFAQLVIKGLILVAALALDAVATRRSQ